MVGLLSLPCAGAKYEEKNAMRQMLNEVSLVLMGSREHQWQGEWCARGPALGLHTL